LVTPVPQCITKTQELHAQSLDFCRFAPQVARPRPGPGSEITPPPKGDRWRDDGQSRYDQPIKQPPAAFLGTPLQRGETANIRTGGY